MEKMKMWIIVVIIVMKLEMWVCDGCLENERKALVELKNYINSPDHSALASWGTNLECCNWTGVECNSNGQVTLLNLGLKDWSLEWSLKDLQLNASLFLPFQHLNSLYLSGFNIAGGLQDHGFEQLSKLNHLEHLDLSYNNLDISIFASLTYISSLKNLSVAYNKLKGTIDISELNNLTSLRELDLTMNKIEGFATSDGFKSLRLANLEVLQLGFNVLNNTVLQLLSDLSNLKFLGLQGNRLGGKINISELNSLRNLRELDISENAIEGFEKLQGGEEFLNLNKLESLNLRLNRFGNNILPFLRTLPSLHTLEISYNLFKGPLNLKELDGMSNLEELDLSGNEITGFVSTKDNKSPTNLRIIYLDNMTTTNERNINVLLQQVGVVWPNLKTLYLRLNILQGQTFGKEYSNDIVEEVFLDYCLLDETFLQSLTKTFPSLRVLSLIELSGTLTSQGLPNFENLEHLYLNETKLDNNFLQKVGTMRSLKTLSMEKCGLAGEIPASQGLCELKHLEELDMNDNNLSRDLPLCLSNLTSLRMLRISANQLTGDISSSPLRSLTSLDYLDISNNLFRIPISLAPLFNHSHLKYFFAYNNTVFADTDHHTLGLTPKFQLEYLYIQGFGEGGSIPKFLYHQHNLEELILPNINLRGNFPAWLLQNNTRLQVLYLSDNLLSGHLLLPSFPHMNLSYLGISNNFLSGSIPFEFGVYLPGLTWVDVSLNNFNGTIPHSLCNPSLYMMDLSRNHISGTIPVCIGKMSQLGALDLSRNNIFGSLPSNFSPLSLMMVDLSYNRLQGSWNDAFLYCSRLFILNLSNNKFLGKIPSWLGRLSHLSYLLLRNNSVQENIPIELCNLKKLSLVDFAHNNISGHIPPCLSFISYWSWQEDEVPFTKTLEFATKGNFYSYQPKILSYLSGLDLSSNNLTGDIPLEIGNLGNIQVLNLSHNGLIGRIPPTISNLKELESFDISNNYLGGTIPNELTQLPRISRFNVSYNNLSGHTPNIVAQFATFEESSYRGNPFLCGWPLPRNCSLAMESSSSATSNDSEEDSNGFVEMEGFYVSFGIAYGMVLLVLVVVLCINPYWRAIWFYYVQLCTDKVSKLCAVT